jgi:2-desacetyl-2-hydroxyethyl bacteriochlorophyllide A dehydrogenase
MKAVLVTETGIEVTTVEDPRPAKGQVVVQVGAAGICGTDIHIIDREIPGARLPVVPGHELAGTIVELGAGVEGSSVGDRVAVEPAVHCGACRFCTVGRWNLCEHGQGIGTSLDGGSAEFVCVPAANCHRVPDSVSMHAAALIEPLSCAIHGMDLLPRRAADHYLIYGAGTMGLLMLQMARASGAASVSVVDSDEGRLGAARRLGADAAATSASGFDREHGWSVVVDCTGVPAAIEDAITRVDRGGTLQVFGVANAATKVSFSPYDIYRNEITIVGSMAIFNSFARAVEMMARGTVDADTVVSHQFALEDYGQAIELFRARGGRKLMVRPDGLVA